MAQKIDALRFRLGFNSIWLSQWYSLKNYSNLFFEDHLIRTYLTTIFNLRGFLSKRCLIKRKNREIFIFLEFYASSYFRYQVPRYNRHKKKTFYKILKIREILTFLKKISQNKIFLNFKNIFIINRIHRKYVRRLRGFFGRRFKNTQFARNTINILNVALRTRAAFFLAQIITKEVEVISRRKRDRKIMNYLQFIRKLVHSIKSQNAALYGIRIHIKGRFKARNRSVLKRYIEGTVPFNTLQAQIDYCRNKAITPNGTFGIHVWLCYR